MECLDASAAVDLVEGRSTGNAAADVEAHVAGCSDCRALIAAVVRSSDAEGATQDDDAPGPAQPVLGRGALVGRYVLIEPHARGGMGDVYKAYDPELERAVALKLVRPGRLGDDARARLIREARALAQLAHPNVVAVHDVGSFGDQVFLAMEFVTGKTLRRWLREDRPSHARIVDAFVAAGRGLLAAHDAGLVHRDFKPDNVVVGDDGRVRVLDFGLARVQLADEPDAAADTVRDAYAPATRTGAVLGTPGYMAPEQHRGGEVDARTDQFAYCVALHEALHGERPFPDVGLADAVLAGRVSEPPRDRDVPGRLRRIVLRGLAVAPADRYPSMAELLADLERDPGARRRRFAIGAGIAAAGAIGAAVIATQLTGGATTPAPCGGAESALAGTWNASRRAELDRAFATADPRLGPEAFAHAAPVLDAYADAWKAMHVDTCEATRVRGEQSEDLLDLRMICLDRRRKDLAALVDLLATSDAALVGRAVQVAGSLPGVAACADIQALTAPVPLPHDPDVRAAVEALHTEIARVEALRLARRLAEGIAAAQALVDHAAAVDYPPVRAEAMFQLAFMHSTASNLAEAERFGEEAVFAAIAARHPEITVRAATELVWDLGVSSDRRDEAHRWARLAEAALASIGGSLELAALIEGALGSMALYESKTDEALKHLTRALELERKVAGGRDSPDVARALANLAIPYYNRSEYERSGALLREAVEMYTRSVGARNPVMMETVQNLAELYVELDQLDDAERFGQEAYDLAVSVYGDQGAEAARALGPLMKVHDARRDFARAATEARQRIAGFERALGPESGELGAAWANLGDIEFHAGDAAASLDDFERALALQTKAYGERSLAVAITSGKMALTLTVLGRFDEAMRRATTAHELVLEMFGADNQSTAEAMVTIAAVHLGAGRRAEARPLLEGAIAIFDRSDAPPSYRAEAAKMLAAAK